MTYGIPYTVRGWDPTDIVGTVEILDETAPEGYIHVVRRTVPGPVILVPAVALTPVDTTPPEPEPGAWLIGDTPAWHDPFYGWRLLDVDAQDADWFEWPRVLQLCGGPNVPIVPLEPRPAPADVKLPAEAKSLYQNTVIVEHYEGSTISMTLPRRLTEWFDPDNAEILGNSFLAAARAAREVKP